MSFRRFISLITRVSGRNVEGRRRVTSSKAHWEVEAAEAVLGQEVGALLELPYERLAQEAAMDRPIVRSVVDPSGETYDVETEIGFEDERAGRIRVFVSVLAPTDASRSIGETFVVQRPSRA